MTMQLGATNTPHRPFSSSRFPSPEHKSPALPALLLRHTTKDSFLLCLKHARHAGDYSERTLLTYHHWCVRFWDALQKQRLIAPAAADQPAGFQSLCDLFLQKLQQDLRSPSSIAQARAALSFLQRLCFPKPTRSHPNQPRLAPDSLRTRPLSREELSAMFQVMDENNRLAAMLMYNGGMRLFEVLRLRVRDLDFTHATVLIRDARGKPSRVVRMARNLYEPLIRHLQHARWRHEEELRHGVAAVRLPVYLRRGNGSEANAWSWRYVFMSLNSPLFRAERPECQDHMHESTLQKSLQRAARAIGLNESISCSNLRASFVEHLVEEGHPIEKVRRLCLPQDLAWEHDASWHLPLDLQSIPSPLDAWNPSPCPTRPR